MATRTEKKIVEITEEHIVAIRCDLCDHYKIMDEDDMALNTFGRVTKRIGYGSQYDGNVYQLDVCDECLNKFGTKIDHRIV